MAFVQVQPFDWAVEFDETLGLRPMILIRSHQGAIHNLSLGKTATLSVPINEYYLPFLYMLALQGEGEKEEGRSFAEKATCGSLSMRSCQLG
jgi:4,5-DOPA dioxygenase extradiol